MMSKRRTEIFLNEKELEKRMKKKLQTRKKSPNVPLICLKCKSSLSRNTPFYKNRHIFAMHSDEDPKITMSFIVPEYHEDAKPVKNNQLIKTLAKNLKAK